MKRYANLRIDVRVELADDAVPTPEVHKILGTLATEAVGAFSDRKISTAATTLSETTGIDTKRSAFTYSVGHDYDESPF